MKQHHKLFTLTLPVLFLSTILYAAGSENGGSPLMDFIWKAVNVAVLIAVIYKFAKKPVAAALNNSAESTKQVIENSREAEKKVSAELSEMRKKIAGLEQKASQMVEVAKQDAEIEKQRIVEEGKQEIIRMKQQASFALEQERRKAEYDLRKWVARESVKLAEAKLKQEMDEDNQNRLVESYLDQLQQSEGGL